MTKNEEKLHPMSELFPVTSICRGDLVNHIKGFTATEASMVSDEQMKAIAMKLGSDPRNQILKSSIRIVADVVIHNVKPRATDGHEILSKSL